MKVQNPREILILFVGDLVAFYLSLALAMTVRSWAWPDWSTFLALATPFSFLFLVWIIIYFISDLYAKQTALARRRLPLVMFNAQLINSTIGIIFFYFIPYFGVTPKTILFICLAFSFILIVLWRRFLALRFSRGRRETVLFLCQGQAVDELKKEFQTNDKYNIKVLTSEDNLEQAKKKATLIVIDGFHEDNQNEQAYFQLIFSGMRFVTLADLYEEIFDRVAVEIINERWFLDNISSRPKPYYDFLKRLFDVILALILGLLSLPLFLLAWILIRLDDDGVFFSVQERVGRGNQIVKVFKIRTRQRAYDSGQWDEPNEITRVGHFLRKTRIDELPQLWNIYRGDMSLVGPRPELPLPAQTYEQAIPFYAVRSLIEPGLSGWAQVSQEKAPHQQIAIEDTKDKLSYDLYYIKNRSLWLDLKIALRTISILLGRKGS